MEVVKVCRECREEYRPEILRCADCGGELEVRYEAERGSWPAAEQAGPAPDPRPPGDYQPIAWSGLAADLTALADRLVEADIPFYLRPRPSEAGAGSAGYEISVRQEEREAALRELAAGTPPDQAVAAAPSSEAQLCPACGHALAAGAVECPDCGLAVGDTAD
jgi:hypothetical protein